MAGRTKAKHVKNLNFQENFKDFEDSEDLPEIEYSQPSVLNGIDHFNILQGLQLTDRHSFVLEWLMTKCDADTNSEMNDGENGNDDLSPNQCSNTTNSLESSKATPIKSGLKATENKVSASGSPILTRASKRKRSPLHDNAKSKRLKSTVRIPTHSPVHSSSLQQDNQTSPVLGHKKKPSNLETSRRFILKDGASTSKNHENIPSTSANVVEKQQTKENEEVPSKKVRGTWRFEDTFKDVSSVSVISRRSKSNTPANYPSIVSHRERTPKKESKSTVSAMKQTLEKNRRYLLQRNEIEATPKKIYEDTVIDQSTSSKKSLLIEKSASQIIQDVDSEIVADSEEQFHISQDPATPEKKPSSTVKEELNSLLDGQQYVGNEFLKDVRNKVKAKDERVKSMEMDKKPLATQSSVVMDIVPAKEKEEDRKKYRRSKK